MHKKDTSSDRLIELFLESYFKDTDDILEFEYAFFQSCELSPCEDEYGKLKRFLMTAVKHLRDVDDSSFSSTFHKLYRDTFDFSDFATKFTMKRSEGSQSAGVVHGIIRG